MCYLLAEQDNIPGAIFFGKLAINNVQKLRQNISKLDKATQMSYIGTVENQYRYLADLLVSMGRLSEAQQVLSMLKEEEYFDYVRREPALVDTIEASLTKLESDFKKGYDEQTGKLAAFGREAVTLKQKAKYGTITPTEETRLVALQEEIKVANDKFKQYVDNLLATMKREDRRNEVVDEKLLKQIQARQGTLAALGEGAVLIAYVITDERVNILLITPSVQLARRYEIKAEDLNHKLFVFREDLEKKSESAFYHREELYDILIKPIEADLKEAGAKTLMLSLDGALRYVPFAALYDGKSYVTENYRVAVYTDVSRDNINTNVNMEWEAVGFGVTKKVEGFVALDAVKDELNGIIKPEGVLKGEIIMDDDFTEKTMKKMLDKQYPVYHIASHFSFNPGNDSDSFLVLGNGKHLSMDRAQGSEFDFKSIELLTLSACNTGMSSQGDGREMEGFGVLAQNKGAKAVIATLWKVADSSTAVFMKNMYSFHEQGKDTNKRISKIGAIQKAQLEFIHNPDGKYPKEYSHPYYWAPFILMGNWK